jgi:hypothetical protein
MPDDLNIETARSAEDELFEMANLYPRTTGLPMTVWVSLHGNARHDVRVKVNMTHGDRMNIDNTAVVAVRPSPHVVAGQLSPEDERAVADWISLNATAIVAYWNGDIDTVQLAQALKPLPG